MATYTILFLASNPATTGRMALDEEARDIEAKIRASEFRDSLTLKTRWAVRTDDLLQALNEDRPTIVHFSGHGVGAPGIVLHDSRGGSEAVKADALKRLFTTLKDDIRVVVLNACYSIEQASAIVEVIDCVVGVNDSLGDEAARKFAAAFYRALGFGRSVKNAFDQGLIAIALNNLDYENAPKLLVRTGVNPDEEYVVPRPLAVLRAGALARRTERQRALTSKAESMEAFEPTAILPSAARRMSGPKHLHETAGTKWPRPTPSDGSWRSSAETGGDVELRAWAQSRSHSWLSSPSRSPSGRCRSSKPARNYPRRRMMTSSSSRQSLVSPAPMFPSSTIS